MAFRDATVVIIETSRSLVRAGLGLHDLLKTPTAEVQARVGLRRDALNGDSGESSRASPLPRPSVNDYLVGAALDEALTAGQEIQISWPFANGDISDYTQAEAIWKYALFSLLPIRRAQNESPVLLCVPRSLSRNAHQLISQIFFERFNVAGFSTISRPIAQLYAANAISGIVVDIGDSTTDITPIYDGFILDSASMSTNIGIKDCQLHLANLLRFNQSVLSAFPSTPNTSDLLGLVSHLQRSSLIRIPSSGETALTPADEGITDIASILVAGREKAIIESAQKKRKATAAEAARAREIEALDLVTVTFNGTEVTLGKERHRFCEPLFDPGVLANLESADDRSTAMALQDAVGHAVGLTEVDQRQYIWGGLFVTGELANHVKGIPTALQSRLAPYILTAPDFQQANDVQTRAIRPISVPEYFAEYRENGDGLAAFLGSSIVAKIIFNDAHGKNFVSKADYTSRGPRAIIEMSPALL